MESVSFSWSVMSPSDFAKFRAVEFDEEALTPRELNPDSGWVVYVAAIDSAGTVVASSTAATGSRSRLSDRDAYVVASIALPAIAERCRQEGYDVPDRPPLLKRRLPDTYRS